MSTPKLRFPEFLNDEGWEQKKLKDLFEIGSGKDYKHLSTGDIPVYGSGGYMLSVDDFLYDGESVCIGRKGTIDKPMLLNGKFWTVDTLFYTHSFKDCSPSFIFSIFQNIDWLKHNEAGGVPSLSKTTINEIPTYIPKPKEQQKIADCLSSLDDLITAQNQKVEALKQHKKGLMQQLFPDSPPAKGEYAEGGRGLVPKLRFPEFENDGEWVKHTINDFAKVTTGNKDTQNKVDDGAYPFFVRSQKVERINSFAYDGEAILTSGDGVGVGKNFHYINGKFDFHQRVYCIYGFNENVYGKFIFQYFSEHFFKRIMQYNAKNSVDSVRMSAITEMPIMLPAFNEQKKIANFLSSIDELISTQTQQLEAYKAHKKGLMQLLFPSLNEVNA